MPFTGDQWPYNNTWGQALNYTYTASGTSVPMTVYPTLVAVPDPEPEQDDSPLTWLRDQVTEITELARAA